MDDHEGKLSDILENSSSVSTDEEYEASSRPTSKDQIQTSSDTQSNDDVAAALRVLQDALLRLPNRRSTSAAENSNSPGRERRTQRSKGWSSLPYVSRSLETDQCHQHSLHDLDRNPLKQRHSVACHGLFYPPLPPPYSPTLPTSTQSLGCRRRFSKQQWLLLLSMLLLDLASYSILSILAPIFPDLAQKRHLSSLTTGIIFSMYALVLVIFSPVVGKLVTVFTPRSIYISGIALAAVSNAAFGFTPRIYDNQSFTCICIILRSSEAIGTSCFLTVIYSVIPTVFPDDINTITGVLETAIGVGMCLGPAVGSWLYPLGGFALPFIALGAFLLLVLPVSFLTFPDDLVQPCSGGVGFCRVLRQCGVLLPSAILVVTAVCQSGLYPTLQPHMGKLGVSVSWVGMVFLLNSAVYSVAAPLVGLALDRWKCTFQILLMGLLLTSLALLLLGNSPILPHINRNVLVRQDIMSIVLLGLSVAMCIVPTYAAMLNTATKLDDGSSMLYINTMVGAIWSSSYSFGDMIGPLVTGFAMEFVSFADVTTYVALMPLLMSIILVTVKIIESCQERRFRKQFVSRGTYAKI